MARCRVSGSFRVLLTTGFRDIADLADDWKITLPRVSN